MPKPLRIALQVLFYGAFALFIGYFSTAPTYRHLPDDAALLRLSFSHPGKLKADCRKRTPEELAKIAPHLRTELECPRERSPVKVHLVLDGATLVDETIEPTGLHQDGAASVYRRIPITAGEHTLSVRLNDDVRVAGFNYTREARLQIQPGQIVLVDFAAERGGILIR